MPGGEILEFGRGKQPQPLTHDVEPAHLDVQGQNEEEPPPEPRRVKVRLGAVVGVVSGLLLGAAAWDAVDDWRGETPTRPATALATLFEQASPTQDSETQWATFIIFNAGEHPVTIEGVTLVGWEPAVPDQARPRTINPGTSKTVLAYLGVDCANPGSQPAPDELAVHVRTVDGRPDTINLAVAHWQRLAESRDWICSPALAQVGAELINPQLGEASLSLALQLYSDREITVVGVESVSPAFSVETTQLPVTGSGDPQPLATTWRVVDCVAAKNFEALLLRLTLDDGSTQETDVGYGPGFASLIRLAERSCPSS